MDRLILSNEHLIRGKLTCIPLALALPSKYLQPSTPRPDNSTMNNLSAFYDTNVNESGVDAFPWNEVYNQKSINQPPKIEGDA